MVTGRADAVAAGDLVEAYVTTYQNPGTRAGKRSKLTDLFAVTGAQHPAVITEADLHAWCTGNGRPLANNSIRQRVSEARAFFAWCGRQGHLVEDPAADLLARHSPLRRYRKVYGKRQGKYPGRWLTYEEAFDRLIPATRDGTDAGLRDELVIRLGLLGMRQAEIAALNWIALARPPSITWNGKGNVPRQATAGNSLVLHLDTYRARYETAHGPIAPGLPVVCRAVSGPPRVNGTRPLHWGQRLNSRNGVFGIVTAAAHRAGLGHVAPHDLRRSTAGILHRATSADGGHHFDLLDIQQVLGHADPATTMKSYLEPIDTALLDKAADFLD